MTVAGSVSAVRPLQAVPARKAVFIGDVGAALLPTTSGLVGRFINWFAEIEVGRLRRSAADAA